MVGVLTWAGIAVFGALGAVARFHVDGVVSSRMPGEFPLGPLVVNLSGTFTLGVVVGAALSHHVLLLAGTGFLGGYTTFSTWMVESERLTEAGDLVLMVANLTLSLVLGVALAAVGWHVGRVVA
jgi:CrcB protein